MRTSCRNAIDNRGHLVGGVVCAEALADVAHRPLKPRADGVAGAGVRGVISRIRATSRSMSFCVITALIELLPSWRPAPPLGGIDVDTGMMIAEEVDHGFERAQPDLFSVTF